MLVEIERLYTEEGKTLREISQVCGTKYETISQKLRARGVDTTSNKGRGKNRLLNHSYFSKIETEDQAYFLGLLFADGNVTPDVEGLRNPIIRIELLEQDKEILKIFAQKLGHCGDLTVNRREGRNNTVTLHFRSKKMAEDLVQYGVVPNKTHLTTKLPLEKIPPSLLIHFLRGFMDGDGSVYKSGNSLHVSFTGCSYEIIDTVRKIGRELISLDDRGVVTEHNGVYKYTFNGKNAISLLKVLYADTSLFLQRKFNIFNENKI